MMLIATVMLTASLLQVANTTKGTDLASLACMLQHCSSQIVSCVTDATCKAGLDCLQACSFNDQARGVLDAASLRPAARGHTLPFPAVNTVIN